MVEVAVDLVHVFEIKSIVELSKLKNYVDNLRFIRTVEAPVLFAIENTLAALKYKMRTDWVFCTVCRFLPSFLFR